MGTLLTGLGWLAALFLAAVAVWSVVIAARHTAKTKHLQGAPGWPAVPLLYGCATVIALTVLGGLPVLAGTVLAALLAVALTWPLARAQILAIRKGQGRGTAVRVGRVLADAAKAGPRWLAADLRNLLSLAHRGPRPLWHRAPAGPEGPESPAQTAMRTIPPLRQDEALGPAPEPHEVEAAAEVPAPWAALCDWVAGFVPEDDNHQSAFIHGNAAGIVAFAHALVAHSETVTTDIGLDPSYGGAVLELADLFANVSGDTVLVDRRYHLIYAAVKKFVDEGGYLPFESRRWFGDPGAGSAA